MELGEPTEIDPNLLFLLESGQVLPGKKDPSRYLLYADWKMNRPPPNPIKEYYHAECFFDAMGRERWTCDIEDYECAACPETHDPHDFRKDRYGYRVRLGEIDMINRKFVPKDNVSNNAHVCHSCISQAFGIRRVRRTRLRSTG
jgi:hypothetical protein